MVLLLNLSEFLPHSLMAKMKTKLKKEVKNRLKKEAILSMLYSPVYFHNLIHKKIKANIGSKLIKLRNTGIF